MILDEGSDLIIYSDDKITEKARIDGATGNISTSGTVDGVDIAIHAATEFAHISSTKILSATQKTDLTDGGETTLHIHRQAAPIQPHIYLFNGADQVVAGAGELTLVRFPAADANAACDIAFAVPYHSSSGTWRLKLVFMSSANEAAARGFQYYCSAYQDGDAYAGWNVASAVAFSVQCTTAWRRYHHNIDVSVSSNEIVTFRILRTAVSTGNYYLVGVEFFKT